MKNYRAFWWVMGITALTYPGINYMALNIYLHITERRSQSGKFVKMIIGNPFSFPEAWHSVAYFSSLFIFIPAIVIIVYNTPMSIRIDNNNRTSSMDGAAGIL